ncbi:ADP-ribosylation factor-like protein 2-binding protein isoform X2 [Topomyia yanbarensis]|nr:ADP-ribosylation factor-like protein 2-binding protein isoform X2 [Topomyia yanbarensis]XP_058812466.1 ADP-ribosylation factor-like protein 2-binding protein isoform X2 [Topomyia yanbarensis]XP_058812468.1 ADP-ribosylation factor-like protein 2-binding protein isoform X2 [Topomyia yanbarensis]
MELDENQVKRQSSTDYFDTVIGHIEDIVIGEEFQNLVNQFMNCYYHLFESDDENKIVYTEIYQKYTNLVETYIVENLNEKMSFFDMDRFALELENKKSQVDGEIFELLYTLTDFLAFKDMLIDYKAFKEGAYDELSKNFSVTSLQK